jgi:hypothetical protein
MTLHGGVPVQCSWKPKSITQSECVFVALGIQNAVRMCHINICGLPRCTKIFSALAHNRYDFRRKKMKKLQNAKLCFRFSL